MDVYAEIAVKMAQVFYRNATEFMPELSKNLSSCALQMSLPNTQFVVDIENLDCILALTLWDFSIPEHGVIPWRTHRCNRGRRLERLRPVTARIYPGGKTVVCGRSESQKTC